MRKTPTEGRAILAGLTAVAILGTALAQTNPLQKKSTSKNAVCPLSESQTQKSIEAFAKMVPTLTEEPRCVNCHGGIDPFADPTKHGGGTEDPKADCSQCHSEMPSKTSGVASKWRLALPEHSFVGKDATTLCKQMRSVFMQGADFVGHLIDDNGNSNFTETAFLGTRGLNQLGRSLVDNYRDEPPQKITHGGLVNLGLDWVNAMGGEFEGDESCGCEPAHYAIRGYYEAKITIGTFVQEMATMGPVDIPITFHDDHSFEGEGTLSFSSAGTGRAAKVVCQGQSEGGMRVKVLGKAVEEFENNHMLLQVTNVSPLSGVVTERCNVRNPLDGGMYPLKGGDKAAFGFEIEGRVGDAQMTRVPLPAPGTIAILRVEVVKQ